jgi:ABC-type cobalamin/Fe3+-siderophores transport system ATPase subunit
VQDFVTRFGATTVHDGVSFTVGRGALVGLLGTSGTSGTGKSVLLREMIGLHRPTAGRVSLLGTDIWRASVHEFDNVRRFGMMFQDGALFSSLTAVQNMAVPSREHTRLAPASADALVALRLAQAGLPAGAGARRPSELSGGMGKRAAIALDSELLTLAIDALHHDVSVLPGQARLAVTAELFDRRQTGRAARRSFAAAVPTSSADSAAAAAALSQAAGRVFDKLLSWLDAELQRAAPKATP